ncbi:hypothetical protein PI87_21925 [Ralstonia sp. A12]|nr:hypothetical protein PI87_21925 [Ralstonia sp. A12]
MAAFVQRAIKNQKLYAANRIGEKLHIGGHALDGHMLGVIHKKQACLSRALDYPTRWVTDIDTHRVLLIARHLPKLDEKQRTLITGRLVRRTRRIAQIPARRVAMHAFGEGAGDDQYLLATRMQVTREM